jgi:hypothetical protein
MPVLAAPSIWSASPALRRAALVLDDYDRTSLGVVVRE